MLSLPPALPAPMRHHLDKGWADPGTKVGRSQGQEERKLWRWRIKSPRWRCLPDCRKERAREWRVYYTGQNHQRECGILEFIQWRGIGGAGERGAGEGGAGKWGAGEWGSR